MEPAWRDRERRGDRVNPTPSTRRERRSTDAETRTGLVDVNFIKFAFEVPQILLREVQRVHGLARRDGLELDGLGHACA